MVVENSFGHIFEGNLKPSPDLKSALVQIYSNIDLVLKSNKKSVFFRKLNTLITNYYKENAIYITFKPLCLLQININEKFVSNINSNRIKRLTSL